MFVMDGLQQCLHVAPYQCALGDLTSVRRYCAQPTLFFSSNLGSRFRYSLVRSQLGGGGSSAEKQRARGAVRQASTRTADAMTKHKHFDVTSYDKLGFSSFSLSIATV
ncbi:hypothetical protein IG631_17452 [Alternaria alternata]|nr:hypothetical protein IG631_17452 [Alternaria alternata]